jgi:hypothetical protein
VTVTKVDGSQRLIFFKKGRAIGYDQSPTGSGTFKADKEADLNVIHIGEERYEIPDMETAIVSPDLQVALPPVIRETLGIRPGQSVHIILYQRRIELLPIRAVTDMCGFLKGIDTTVEQEPDRTWML